MVNSPSRPNPRPPAPLECGGMTPLWRRETCLPGHRPARPPSNQIKHHHSPTRWIGRTGRRMVEPCAREKSSPGGADTGEGEGHHHSIPFAPTANQGRNPCNRASSRQIKANAIFSSRHSFGRPTRWIGRTGRRMANRVPGKIPLLGERTQVRASVTTIQSLLPPQPIKAKTPVIVLHQGKSRQIKANQGKRHFFQPSFIRSTHPLDWSNRPTNGRTVCQGKFLCWGRGHR